MFELEDFYGRTIEIPEDRVYDSVRELWVQEREGRVRIGLTHAGVVLTGGVEVLDPAVSEGQPVEVGDALFEVEGFKASQDITAPLAGRVIAVNLPVIHEPERLDEACYGEAWLLEMEPRDRSRLSEFLEAGRYLEGLRTSEHCAGDGLESARGETAPAGTEQTTAVCGPAFATRSEAWICPECGTAARRARLKPGQTVVVVGGAGEEAVFAASEVGPEGRVLDLEVSQEAVRRAEERAGEAGFPDPALPELEFMLWDQVGFPLADGCCDALVLSCVTNRAPRRDRVFQDAFRVLRQGGVLVLSELVLAEGRITAAAGPQAAGSAAACASGAWPVEKLAAFLERAGFMSPRVEELEDLESGLRAARLVTLKVGCC